MTMMLEERAMLRDAARGWVGQNAPVSAFRKRRDEGEPQAADAALWREISAMGWAATVIPEACDGAGLDFAAAGVVLEELGRTLVASPMIASGIAASSALMLGGSEAQKAAWLPRIASGELVAALAVDEGAHHRPGAIRLSATRRGAGHLLAGTKTMVPYGASAGLVVVAARLEGGEPALFVVPGEAPGLAAEPLSVMDYSDVARLHFDAVEVGPEALLAGTVAGSSEPGSSEAGGALLERVLDRARAALCAEMLGTALQAFDMTLDYLKTRVQFSQIIGSFQALQHRAALMFAELQLARSVVEAALAAIDADSPDVPRLVSLAKARMGDTLHLVSRELIQLHGGIGMTDAHDAGFYLKRACVAEAMLGNAAFHRDRYARIVGI